MQEILPSQGVAKDAAMPSKGKLTMILTDEDGTETVEVYENLLTDLYKRSVAGYLASTLIGPNNTHAPPSHMALGTGAFLETGQLGADSNQIILEDRGVGQRFTPASGIELESVFFELERNNDPNQSPEAPLGFLTAKLYAFGNPVGAIIAESSQVLAAGIPQNSRLTKFTFDSPVALIGGTQYLIVVSGAIGGDYNGSATRNIAAVLRGTSGQAYSVTGTVPTALSKDCVTRLLEEPEESWTSIRGEVARAAIVSAIDADNIARLSVIFRNDQAVGTWGHIGLFNAETVGDLIAVRSISITKTAEQSLTIFWEITTN